MSRTTYIIIVMGQLPSTQQEQNDFKGLDVWALCIQKMAGRVGCFLNGPLFWQHTIDGGCVTETGM